MHMTGSYRAAAGMMVILVVMAIITVIIGAAGALGALAVAAFGWLRSGRRITWVSTALGAPAGLLAAGTATVALSIVDALFSTGFSGTAPVALVCAALGGGGSQVLYQRTR